MNGKQVSCQVLVLALFAAVNPCRLLTRSDFRAVQGEAYVEAVRTLHSGGEDVEQCLFRLPTASKSVTLEITPRKTWPFGDGKSKWTGNRANGALYVLAPSAVLRISVGGAEDVEAKTARAKELARRAMRRMAR